MTPPTHNPNPSSIRLTYAELEGFKPGEFRCTFCSVAPGSLGPRGPYYGWNPQTLFDTQPQKGGYLPPPTWEQGAELPFFSTELPFFTIPRLS